MQNSKNISHKTILFDLIGNLNVRYPNNDYWDEYNRVIGEFAKRIKEADYIVAGKNDEIRVRSDEMYKIMSDVSGFISLCITKYLKGEVSGANWAFIEQWKKTQIPKYEECMNNRVFFRMRNKKKKIKRHLTHQIYFIFQLQNVVLLVINALV